MPAKRKHIPLSDTSFSAAMLGWYDKNARDLPWRVPPGSNRRPDPYCIWLSEIMLQQTTVAAVKGYFQTFLRRWPTVQDLAAAEDDAVMAEWAGLGYYARARNLLKCARVVCADFDGVFPGRYEELLTLPGIGPYTAGAISAIAFDRKATVVDGNIERVLARIKGLTTPLPAVKKQISAIAAELTPQDRPGDYVQALMDLGATICTPRKPACDECPLKWHCVAQANGMAAQLPFRSPKPVRPTKLGFAYVVRRADGAWLLERRPEKGLLGGMQGWPGSQWGDAPADTPPIRADWVTHTEPVRHTFTHFHLQLVVRSAVVPMAADPGAGQFIPAGDFSADALPTVMRKVFNVAAGSLADIEIRV